MVYVSVGHTLILSWTNSHYWLRDHTSSALMELEWRLKVFPVLTIFVLKFITPRYTLSFSYSEIYIAQVIYHEWSRSVIFLLCICIFPSEWNVILLHHILRDVNVDNILLLDFSNKAPHNYYALSLNVIFVEEFISKTLFLLNCKFSV